MEPETKKPLGALDRPSQEADWLIIRGRVIRIGRIEAWAFLAVMAVGVGWSLWFQARVAEAAEEFVQVYKLRGK